MIKKFVTIITNLIALIFGDRATIKALQGQIADLNTIITDLRAAVEQDTHDDAALETAAAEAKSAQAMAEAALADLNTEIAAEAAKADAEVARLTADTEVPIVVDPATGTVTPQ